MKVRAFSTTVPVVSRPDSETLFDVGIAGAGQLAQMTVLAGIPLGLRIAILGTSDEPASDTAAGRVDGSFSDAVALRKLGRVSRVVTLESEFVDPGALADIVAAGTPVRPDPTTLIRVQDKALQKQLLADAGLPLPRWIVAESLSDLDAIGRDLGWPLMLKRRRLGYDGYGNSTCANVDEAREAMRLLGAEDGVLVEAFVPFERELAVMVARRFSGGASAYPVVETVQRNHVCSHVIAPAPIPASQATAATNVALAAAEAANGVGVTGVELFAGPDGSILVNELAPRPHNSGHFTIEACETSQFENHLRGVLDLPLGPCGMQAAAAAMVNILGARTGLPAPDLGAAMSVPGAHVHLYGKREVRPGRKMGHVTTLGATTSEALARATTAAQALNR